MENTIKLVQKQHDVLVDVIQYLDSTKQSNTLIRSQVDTILNFEKKLKAHPTSSGSPCQVLEACRLELAAWCLKLAA